jgi:hypothetical protein
MLDASSEFIQDNGIKFKSFCLWAFELFYGMEIMNVNKDLIDVLYDSCLGLSEPITFEDLKCCFTFAKIEKIQGQKITREEFMTPIREYIKQKQILRQCVEIEWAAKQKEIASASAEEQFFLRAKQKYINSLEFNEWMGDMFEARVIADKFWRQMRHEWANLKDAARDVYIRDVAKNQVEDAVQQILPKKIYYLAQETVKLACKNGMQW